MCTAVSLVADTHYFGRNLDYEHGFGEKIVLMPQNFSFSFRNGRKIDRHAALMGIALPYQDYPLYFDAINEYGVGMAGLNFPYHARYKNSSVDKQNIASFELIPWVLLQSKSVEEAVKLLHCTNITQESFDATLPPSPLHWILCDKKRCITVEQTADGLQIYENSVGVLTNEPPFPMQMFRLNDYQQISVREPENQFCKEIDLVNYSRGLGGLGLPGDFSSVSRFIKACFVKLNSVFGTTEQERVAQCFRILYSVSQPEGCVRVEESYEKTRYTVCYNTEKGICYFSTYSNLNIQKIEMKKETICGTRLLVYEMEEAHKQ